MTRVAEEEAQISDGVVAFSRLQAFDCVIQTVLADAKVEAASYHLVARYTKDLLDTTGSIRDCQGSSEAVEEKSGARLVRLALWAKRKLSGQVRQHMVARVLGG